MVTQLFKQCRDAMLLHVLTMQLTTWVSTDAHTKEAHGVLGVNVPIKHMGVK